MIAENLGKTLVEKGSQEVLQHPENSQKQIESNQMVLGVDES